MSQGGQVAHQIYLHQITSFVFIQFSYLPIFIHIFVAIFCVYTFLS